MRRKAHDRVAVELARLLHLDEELVLMGARLPDLDRHIGKHRRTLHNPWVLGVTTLVDPAFFVGCASHLILDLVPCKVERLASSVRGVFDA